MKRLNEAKFKLGSETFTNRKLSPIDILDLAKAYAKPQKITKLVGRKLDQMVTVANDLAALTGKTQLDPDLKSGKKAVLLVLLKDKLLTTPEYVALYKSLVDLHKHVNIYVSNSSPEMRNTGGAGRAARQDMRGEFDEGVVENSNDDNPITEDTRHIKKNVMIDDEEAINKHNFTYLRIRNAIGVVFPKTWRSDGYLFKLDSFDKKVVKGVKIKSDERIFRYRTDITDVGDMRPLIKINYKKGLVYFLTQESLDTGETIEFERKGVTVHYLRLRDTAINESVNEASEEDDLWIIYDSFTPNPRIVKQVKGKRKATILANKLSKGNPSAHYTIISKDGWKEMKSNPHVKLSETEQMTGGNADNMTLPDIANKHNCDIDQLTKEFQRGIKVEMEHTDDTKVAEEITLDHLFEDPKYYDKLATIDTHESINEAQFKPKQVQTVVNKVKKQLIAKWKKRGGYENFGQKEVRKLEDKFVTNPLGSYEQREIANIIQDFDDWAMSYDGTNESINEATYHNKADALTAYFRGKVTAQELSDIVEKQFGTAIATKKELADFLKNKFIQVVISDTYGIPAKTLVKKSRELIQFAENIDKSVNEAKDEPQIIKDIRDVVKNGYKKIKDPVSGKLMLVDSFTASHIITVYDNLSSSNQKKYAAQPLLRMSNIAFKLLKKVKK